MFGIVFLVELRSYDKYILCKFLLTLKTEQKRPGGVSHKGTSKGQIFNPESPGSLTNKAFIFQRPRVCDAANFLNERVCLRGPYLIFLPR